ncbi:DUF6585 family protein [Kitasatospora aureofaciens]|uniref:DUF6585 family protein n=1 Tax=Kitasatospora aureofaciens TaxID=1894 RepID=UPI0033CD6FA4
MGHPTGPDDNPLSKHVPKAAAQHQLGGHRATYVPAPLPSIFQRSEIVVVSVILAIMLSAGIALAPMSPALAIFCTVPIPVLLASRFVHERHVRRSRTDAGLHFYEHGLVIVSRGKLRVLRWDAMTVYQNIGRYHTFGRSNRIKHAYTLRDRGGQWITIRAGFPHPEEWGPRIQQAVTDAQLTDAIAALRAGETLAFGHFRVNVTAVEAGRKRVPWAQVEGVGASRQGLVRIEVAGKRAEGLSGDPVRMFPNLQLFTFLVEQLRR